MEAPCCDPHDRRQFAKVTGVLASFSFVRSVGGLVQHLVEIAATFPVLKIPNWATKLVFGVVVLGCPIALLLAWAFELTPEGVKRTEEVPREQSIARSTGRKLNFAIIGVLVLCNS